MSSPNPVPYRGPLQWMQGAPTGKELLVIGVVLVLGVLLLLAAYRLIRGPLLAIWQGPDEPSRGGWLGAALCAASGTALLALLWLELESIAARMGITVLTLAVLLSSELPARGGRRSRR